MSQDDLKQKIDQFFTSEMFGVVGASNNREKYGNKVFRAYLKHHKSVIPVSLTEKRIEGVECVSRIEELPDTVQSLSIITPPPVTEKIVDQAIAKGVKHIWMQPGAESAKAIQKCVENNITIIAGGPCILMTFALME